MIDKTFDYRFARRVISRRIRKNIVWAEYDLQWIPFDKKIVFALSWLKQVPFSRLKVIIPFWEEYGVFQKILGNYNHSLSRIYKVGSRVPGLIEICFDECFDEKLIRTLIRKHYGYELGKTDSLSLDMIFIFEKDDDITICHLYDDRGFHVFYMKKK